MAVAPRNLRARIAVDDVFYRGGADTAFVRSVGRQGAALRPSRRKTNERCYTCDSQYAYGNGAA